MWTTIALLTTLGVAPAQADLALTHVRSTHGMLGPERLNETLSPGDIYFLCFDIEGVKVDEEGKVRYSMGIDVSDPTGKPLFRQVPRNLEARTSLGGTSVPAFATLNVGLDTPPGDYTVKVRVKDLASNKEQSLTRNVKVLPRDLALVRAAVSVDTEAQYPAAVFAPGQGVWIHGHAVGFARNGANQQPNLLFELRVLDESGQPTLGRTMTHTVDKGIPPKESAVPMAFPLSLNRPGKFTVELQLTDQNSGKKARTTFPITVQSAK